MARRGKIAQLTRNVRDELNERLENGESGKELLEMAQRIGGGEG